MARAAIAAIAAALAWGPGAAAQPPAPRADSAVVQLPEVLVRGSRPVVTPGGAGAITAALDSIPLTPDPTMEEVLRALPGTHLRTNSRGEAEVTVRGSESRQVAVLLDGVPLTFAWDGRADVSVIPVLAVREVTLVRGLSSLSHGPNTLGGVVEFDTRDPDPAGVRRELQLRSGVDQFGAYGVAASVAAPLRLRPGVFTARAGAGFRDSPGQGLPGTVAEPVPTGRGMRRNTDVRQANGFLSLRLDTDGGAFLSLLGTGYQAERGIAAQLGVASARFWRYPRLARGIGILSAGSGRHPMPWGGRADVQVSAGLDRGRTEIDAYSSRQYSTVTSQEDGEDRIWTLRSVASQSLGQRASLALGFSRGDILHDEVLDGVLNPYEQHLWDAFGQATIGLPGFGAARRFDLSLGTALDGASTPVTGDKPSLGDLQRWGGRFGLAVHLDGGTTAHASVSRRARFPSLRELYSGGLKRFEPNPALLPENLLAVETGVTSRTAHGDLQLVGFHHLLSDAVVKVRLPGPAKMDQRVNQRGIRSTGAEALASRAFGRLELGGDLVVQSVRVLDPAAGLARPENMPGVMAGLRARAPLAAGLSVATEVRFTGEQFVLDPDSGLESRLAPAGRWDLEVSREWPLGAGTAWFDRMQVRASLDNLTDAVQYDAFGLPRPGRTLRMDVCVN